jgi:MGT family glycosyltransferase
MNQPPIVIVSMPERGHFNRLRPLIADLAKARIPTYVFTDLMFREEVDALGGRFVDLFAGRSIVSADATSIPIPCRYVSFAGRYAEAMAREIATLRPAVLIHDTFAVIGTAVANILGIPRVNVCAGHNLSLVVTPEALGMPKVFVSNDCLRGVEALRVHYGMPNACPFSYASGLSPHLNVYCEPPEFLCAEERLSIEPVAFFGSLWTEQVDRETTAPAPFGEETSSRLRVYVSFGTVIWRYYEREAIAALRGITEALMGMPSVVAVVGLGGRVPNADTHQLASRNVRVESYLQQWDVLREAAVFITHHGLNSTHEAIYHQTPMISYPFFSDQPGLAKRCQELGLAVPLASALRGRIDPEDVRAAMACLTANRETMQERLAEARSWEMKTIRMRPQVIERIVGLSRG